MTMQLVQYVLLGALRDKLLLSMMLVFALLASVTVFLGSSAIVEHKNFSVVLTSGGVRLASVLGLVLFVVFFLRRCFESKDVEFLLSRPIGRVQFVLSYSLALSLIAIILSMGCGLVIYVISPSFTAGHALWILSICVENIIMANLALFFAMVLSSASAGVLASLGFYVLVRMMGQLLGIVESDITDGALMQAVGYTFQIISMLCPRLDLMGQTSWLIYGVSGDIGPLFILTQGVIYTGLILSACLVDLLKRQF